MSDEKITLNILFVLWLGLSIGIIFIDPGAACFSFIASATMALLIIYHEVHKEALK